MAAQNQVLLSGNLALNRLILDALLLPPSMVAIEGSLALFGLSVSCQLTSSWIELNLFATNGPLTTDM